MSTPAEKAEDGLPNCMRPSVLGVRWGPSLCVVDTRENRRKTRVSKPKSRDGDAGCGEKSKEGFLLRRRMWSPIFVITEEIQARGEMDGVVETRQVLDVCPLGARQVAGGFSTQVEEGLGTQGFSWDPRHLHAPFTQEAFDTGWDGVGWGPQCLTGEKTVNTNWKQICKSETVNEHYFQRGCESKQCRQGETWRETSIKTQLDVSRCSSLLLRTPAHTVPTHGPSGAGSKHLPQDPSRKETSQSSVTVCLNSRCCQGIG